MYSYAQIIGYADENSLVTAAYRRNSCSFNATFLFDKPDKNIIQKHAEHLRDIFSSDFQSVSEFVRLMCTINGLFRTRNYKLRV